MSVTLQYGDAVKRSGWADLIGVGRAFIANPDLPLRWQRGLPLNTPEAATFFGGGAKGLMDYPLAQA